MEDDCILGCGQCGKLVDSRTAFLRIVCSGEPVTYGKTEAGFYSTMMIGVHASLRKDCRAIGASIRGPSGATERLVVAV